MAGTIPARLAKWRARAAQRNDQEGEALESADEEEPLLTEVLEHFKLTKYETELREAGVEGIDDIAYLQDSDLAQIGMPMIPRRKLLEAMGADWRTPQEGAAGGAGGGAGAEGRGGAAAGGGAAVAAAGAAGAAGRGATFAAVGLQMPKEDDLSAEAQAELHQLLAEVADRAEDFAAVNGLDSAASGAIAQLQPWVALRTMGLVGRGNAFMMHGIRRPSAAVFSRSRAAQAEVQQGRAGGLPYEDWKRLVEDFAEANGLPDDIREALRGLSRTQALKVMGFTSGLRFMVPSDSTDVDAEVTTRITVAMSDEPMVPIVPRGLTPHNYETRPPRRQPPKAAPVPRERSRSRGRRSSAGVAVAYNPGMDLGQHADDLVPNWHANLKTFIQINELDARCAQALADMTKMQALQVMGLMGRENSFVIRGCRNTNAAVMQRLAKAQGGAYGTEPFAQLSKLLDEFISLNGFDARSAEVLRTLPQDILLNVMGFTAENAFVISGVRNTNAALMARITAAQRRTAR